MTDHSMTFNAPMIRALLNGTKTQDRRPLKVQPVLHNKDHMTITLSKEAHGGRPEYMLDLLARYGKGPKVGDRIWCRETWADLTKTHGVPWEKFNAKTGLYERGVKPFAWHRADGDYPEAYTGDVCPQRWLPCIHMPRWASRLTLIVTDVRVQRLQDISEEDAKAEGVRWTGSSYYVIAGETFTSAREAFETFWNSIYGPDAWERNDWVTAQTFTVHKCNIDRMGSNAD